MAFRSVLFNVLFYLLMIAMMIVCAPVMVLGRPAALSAVRLFSRLSMALHRAVTGIRHEYRGFDSIPPGGSLVALKHQSVWETIALLAHLPAPAFVLKKELMRIPLFGWWARASGMIAVDRSGGVAALHEMTRDARAAVTEGRQVMIFPEGTRREAGAPPDYKPGIVHLYRELGAPIVPVALNSGLFWPRRTLVHRKGAIVAEVQLIIPAGLEPRQAFRRMRDEIETACDRLLLEAARDGAYLEPTARARVAALEDGVTPAA
ncbi:MAG TPA: lysophospholipid acyltransferase family protein [Methylomirabilota bacterium]|nr:lysophospholipid acyltransferase family protein [Methylomirabilota bacterium]